ncbi:lysozyme inhibitor LprI family protein [Erwinia tasmaniensis]|uniref:lysozyme inhibitor LprI family protein n=1 Tax=Erwinia tasmaniensis TaxID=338565 RepID=UPI003A4DA501
MNNYFALMLVVFSFSTYVCADSLSEQDDYLKIKHEYVEADGELNNIYKEQIQEYKKEGAQFYGQSESKDIYLKKSQLAWIKMRDADCDYETYESRTGTAFSSIYQKCLLDKTNERIEYLRGNN